jgi:pre-mRNA 3'-end-processing factor FIP1
MSDICVVFSVIPGASKGVDLDVVGKINGVSVYEFDVDSVDDKPWRRPGNYKH